MAKTRVAVVFGGRSGEHEVSLASARSVMAALDRTKYEVIPVAITKQGKWLSAGDSSRLLANGHRPENADDSEVSDGQMVALAKTLPLADGEAGTAVDVVFPVLHGTYGEDGTLQGMLEMAGLPYVGAGVLGSALGMDKALMKVVFRAHGLPVVEAVSFKTAEWRRSSTALMERIGREIGYPCFVKPANLGSSVGISKAHAPTELAMAVDLALQYDRKVVVEKAVDAREIECSVLGNDDPVASVVGEIVPTHEFYDYDAKYVSGDTDLIIPARLSKAETARVQSLAVRAFKALDCEGLARVDFFLDRVSGEIYLNEINTMPGFTVVSMYPKLWEASGLSYNTLVDRLISLALERHEHKKQVKTSFAP